MALLIATDDDDDEQEKMLPPPPLVVSDDGELTTLTCRKHLSKMMVTQKWLGC